MLEIETSPLEILQKKHGLMQCALMSLSKNSDAVKKSVSKGFFAQAEEMRLRMEEQQFAAEEVAYLEDEADLCDFYSDSEFVEVEEVPQTILENEDGVFYISENIETDGVKLDLSFLELVNSVLR